jgi:hypothetical protein
LPRHFVRSTASATREDAELPLQNEAVPGGPV